GGSGAGRAGERSPDARNGRRRDSWQRCNRTGRRIADRRFDRAGHGRDQACGAHRARDRLRRRGVSSHADPPGRPCAPPGRACAEVVLLVRDSRGQSLVELALTLPVLLLLAALIVTLSLVGVARLATENAASEAAR